MLTARFGHAQRVAVVPAEPPRSSNKKPRRAKTLKAAPAWDSSVTDLDSYKLSQSEQVRLHSARSQPSSAQQCPY